MREENCGKLWKIVTTHERRLQITARTEHLLHSLSILRKNMNEDGQRRTPTSNNSAPWSVHIGRRVPFVIQNGFTLRLLIDVLVRAPGRKFLGQFPRDFYSSRTIHMRETGDCQQHHIPPRAPSRRGRRELVGSSGAVKRRRKLAMQGRKWGLVELPVNCCRRRRLTAAVVVVRGFYRDTVGFRCGGGRHHEIGNGDMCGANGKPRVAQIRQHHGGLVWQSTSERRLDPLVSPKAPKLVGSLH